LATWLVREDGGTWLVRHGRTSQEFPTEDEALLHVRTHRRRGDKVVMEESDGYRIPISPRRHWRR
jgi:hypothetical protein